MEDVVVVGAGLSGLTAAQALHQANYRVVVVDKSRGLGGRVATRRIDNTVVDHGCRYLRPFQVPQLSPIAKLLAAGTLQPWQPERFELGADGVLTPTSPGTLYTAPQGMSSIAKGLARGLTIHRHWRASAITPLSQGWRIEGEALGEASQGKPSTLEARAIALALPAPQAMTLLQAAVQDCEQVSELLHRLRQVDFEAVITVMAGYDLGKSAQLSLQTGLGGWMVTSQAHPTLRWMALDSSKRINPKEAVVVLHSSPTFASNALNTTHLEPVGQTLLSEAARLEPWIGSPQWMQIHRWRYGFVKKALGVSSLSTPELPSLVGCGDWCNGGNAEGAIASGHAAAAALSKTLSS